MWYFDLFCSSSLSSVWTLRDQPFTTKYLLWLFQIPLLQLIDVSIFVPVSMKFLPLCITLKYELSVFSTCFDWKFKTHCPPHFLLNHSWTYSWHFLFNWLLSLINFSATKIHLRWCTSLEGEPCGKLQNRHPHSFATQYSMTLFLTIILWIYFVVVHHFPSIYKNFAVDF